MGTGNKETLDRMSSDRAAISYFSEEFNAISTYGTVELFAARKESKSW